MVGLSKVLVQLLVEGGLAQRHHRAAQRGDLPRDSHGLLLQLLFRHYSAQQPMEQGLLSRNGLPSKKHLQGDLREETRAIKALAF